MPPIIEQTLQDSPLLVSWYSWGCFVGLLAALGATLWIFLDSHRTEQDAALWRSLATAATVLVVPALLPRLHAGFAFEMRDSLPLIAFLSMAGVLLAFVSAIAYAATRRTGPRCSVCDRPQAPEWSQCPYHPPPVVSVSEPVAPPQGVSAGGDGGSSVTQQPGGDWLAGRPAQPKKTVLLQDEVREALALLVITSGPYANTTLPLMAGVTRIGRTPSMNDHTIDDEAVSGQHVSIRYADGKFVVTDLDTGNGTFVNGRRIDNKHTLAPNDVLTIGKTKLVFMQVPDERPSEEANRDDDARPVPGA